MSDPSSTESLNLRIEELESQLKACRRSYNDLTERASRNRDLIEHLPHEVHVWKLVRNEDGSIRTWKLDHANPAALNAWSKSLDDVIGRTPHEIFGDEKATERFMPIVQKIFDENEPYFWEEEYPATGQTLQMVSIPYGDHFISTGLDISDQKQLQEEIKQLQKMDAIGQLAGGIAHDFNNQLTGILGYAELLEDALTDSTALEDVRNIRTSAMRSVSLTAQLLAFARKGTLEMDVFEIGKIVNDTISILGHTINRAIKIEKPASTETPLFLRADAGLIQNALLNVALNGCDAMPNGGTLTFSLKSVDDEDPIWTRLAADPVGPYVHISIRDTGIGIEEEIIEKIFEPFFTTREDGNGMGLSSAFGTIKRHDGHILVDSAVGEGSCFHLLVPRCDAPVEQPESPSRTPDARREADSPLRILVVDDEPLLRDLCSRMLSRKGHQVITASNGTEATREYAEDGQNIDVVILDMNMPGPNGLETFRELKRIDPDVVALIASGYNLEQTSESFLQAGIRGFVQKPFRAADLTKAISRAISATISATNSATIAED